MPGKGLRLARGEVASKELVQGQQFDSETGLAYNRHRYYDPSNERFISQDPLGVLGGTNAYQYVPSPTQWTDPLGLRKRLGCKGKFHSFHDFELPEDKLFASDAVQFRPANKTLIERMNTDTEYRRDMLGRNPALLNWMKDLDLSKSPPGMTWHHNDAPGVLNLVSFDDHRDNHGIYHPDGSGGRDKWGGGDPGRRGKLNQRTGCPK